MKSLEQYIQIQGELFNAVQQQKLFKDNKTFVDSIPKHDPKTILQHFQQNKQKAGFNLKSFINTEFTIPNNIDETSHSPIADSMKTYINNMWQHLSRTAKNNQQTYNTLIDLPYDYIVPGGRFREIYYWDSYFTAVGLAATKQIDKIENYIKNFCHLIDTLGHIPNGNRIYYKTRSQPPFLVCLIELLEQHSSKDVIANYIPALEKEYKFWMAGKETLNANNRTHRRLVYLDKNAILNRYYDDDATPRPESYTEDIHLTAGLSSTEQAILFRHIRAACESGWDFSSRWLQNPEKLNSLYTTDIIPIDLNSILYHVETYLAGYFANHHQQKAKDYQKAAHNRKQAINTYCWHNTKGYYFDCHWPTQQPTNVWSLAGVYPLFFKLCNTFQAENVAHTIKHKFLCPGGLVTTTTQTAQQWDSPNGWAPLQWLAIQGLTHYDKTALAKEITQRWLNTNTSFFKKTGKMLEKYNVVDPEKTAGGGEYDIQDGFGWTNGVAIALM